MNDYPVRLVTWAVGLVVVMSVLLGVAVAAPAGGPSDTATAPTATTSDAVDSVPDNGTQANSRAETTQQCIACHEDNHPGMVKQYKESAHSESGVVCLDCHGAKDSEPTAEKHFGSVISPIVSPKDCAECHDRETEQFHDSMHDEAAFYSASSMVSNNGTGTGLMPTGWNNNILTHNSRASAEAGCAECHGTDLQVLNDEHPNQPEDNVKIQGYNNQGIGRFNPDGSIGSCAACHPQHRFSLEQARKPGACIECHLGPDHPQKEIYEESKHGTMFHHSAEDFNLSSDHLTAKDMTAPTCAVCHMSGLGDSKQTHDVSSRLKWELEPVYSYPTSKKYETGSKRFELNDQVADFYEQKYGLEDGALDSVPTGAPNPFAALETHRPDLYQEYVVENDELYPDIEEGDNPTRWDSLGGDSHASAQTKRDRMKDICTECHGSQWVNAEFEERDRVPHTYNAVYVAATEKYYEPIKDIAPKAPEYDTSIADNLVWEMWHHEGRRWRMGALMQGQDYEHWHGSYMVQQDVLKLAHLKAVYENTSVGSNPGVQESVEEPDEASGSVLDQIPTGSNGVVAGGIAGLALVGSAGAAGLIWRRKAE